MLCDTQIILETYIHLHNSVNTFYRLVPSHMHVTIFPFQIYVVDSLYEKFQKSEKLLMLILWNGFSNQNFQDSYK